MESFRSSIYSRERHRQKQSQSQGQVQGGGKNQQATVSLSPGFERLALMLELLQAAYAMCPSFGHFFVVTGDAIPVASASDIFAGMRINCF